MLLASDADHNVAGDDVNEFLRLSEYYKKLDAAAIKEAAAAYLNPGNYVRVALFPETPPAAAKQAARARRTVPGLTKRLWRSLPPSGGIRVKRLRTGGRADGVRSA